MSVLTKEQVLKEFKNAKEDSLFCAYCYEELEATKEDILYCSNENCFNDRQYNQRGEEINES